tara:strand:- start:30 stop:254 length:225 start_codon:yes stop_codon:yes gene_type:complete
MKTFTIKNSQQENINAQKCSACNSIIKGNDDIEYQVPSQFDIEQICESLTLFLRSGGYIGNTQQIGVIYYDDLK